MVAHETRQPRGATFYDPAYFFYAHYHSLPLDFQRGALATLMLCHLEDGGGLWNFLGNSWYGLRDDLRALVTPVSLSTTLASKVGTTSWYAWGFIHKTMIKLPGALRDVITIERLETALASLDELVLGSVWEFLRNHLNLLKVDVRKKITSDHVEAALSRGGSVAWVAWDFVCTYPFLLTPSMRQMTHKAAPFAIARCTKFRGLLGTLISVLSRRPEHLRLILEDIRTDLNGIPAYKDYALAAFVAFMMNIPGIHEVLLSLYHEGAYPDILFNRAITGICPQARQWAGWESSH